jgi:cbb3-type cytochrome oxidase maturation protein
MSILFVMIPLALVLLAVAVALFFWAVGSGQFDDLDAQGAMVLFDEHVRVAPRGDFAGSASIDQKPTGSRS